MVYFSRHQQLLELRRKVVDPVGDVQVAYHEYQYHRSSWDVVDERERERRTWQRLGVGRGLGAQTRCACRPRGTMSWAPVCPDCFLTCLSSFVHPQLPSSRFPQSLPSVFLKAATMSQSLVDECTPLKRKYDACFNAWFEGYLEPAVSAGANAEQRTKFEQEKAAEFESSCGKIWQEYRACVQVSPTLDASLLICLHPLSHCRKRSRTRGSMFF